jgi:hypothetical protein
LVVLHPRAAIAVAWEADVAFGIDYSFGNGLSANRMKAAGVHFVARYLSWQPNPKNINKIEFDNLVKSGLHVVLVWEGTGRDLVNGFRGGQHDAQEANRQVNALGAHGCPVYFAPCDYDAPQSDQGLINGYLDGAASVIGHGRTGMYGGYWPLSRAWAGHHMSWAWQTYAWSGGNWLAAAHLQQYQNGAMMGPAEVDYDRSMKLDCGWWPRPSSGAPPPPAHKAAPAPAHPAPAQPGGPYRKHLGDRTLGQMAHDRGTTVEHLWVTTVRAIRQSDLAIIADAKLPPDFPVYTSAP